MSIRYLVGATIFAGAFAPAIVSFPGTGSAVAFTCVLGCLGYSLILGE